MHDLNLRCLKESNPPLPINSQIVSHLLNQRHDMIGRHARNDEYSEGKTGYKPTQVGYLTQHYNTKCSGGF